MKIDRSFLEGIREDKPLTLLRGVARLSADLGMQVVVEGIETNEQLEIVAADGTVTEVQGYLFGRPVAANQIRQLLIASHARRPSDDERRRPSPARSTGVTDARSLAIFQSTISTVHLGCPDFRHNAGIRVNGWYPLRL